jgi:hypothetical protein
MPRIVAGLVPTGVNPRFGTEVPLPSNLKYMSSGTFWAFTDWKEIILSKRKKERRGKNFFIVTKI